MTVETALMPVAGPPPKGAPGKGQAEPDGTGFGDLLSEALGPDAADAAAVAGEPSEESDRAPEAEGTVEPGEGEPSIVAEIAAALLAGFSAPATAAAVDGEPCCDQESATGPKAKAKASGEDAPSAVDPAASRFGRERAGSVPDDFWGGRTLAVPEAPVSESTEQGQSTEDAELPSVLRARAAEAFRNRSERLWGAWMRPRAPGRGEEHTFRAEEPESTRSAAVARLSEAIGGWAGRAASAQADLSAGSAGRGQVEGLPSAPAAGQAGATALAPALGSDHGPADGTSTGADNPGGRPAARAEASPVHAGGSPALDGTRGSAETASARPGPSGQTASGPPVPAHQVAQAVRVCLARGGNRVSLQLQPESLGKVHVELARDAGGLTAHFRVETPQAHQALAGDVALLRQSLEAKGVVLVQVHVDLEDGTRQHASHGEGSRRRRRRLTGGEDDSEAVAEPSLAARVWRPWGFETRI